MDLKGKAILPFAMYMYIYIYIYIYIYVYIYIYMYVCMYVCMFVCMYVCIYIYVTRRGERVLRMEFGDNWDLQSKKLAFK